MSENTNKTMGELLEEYGNAKLRTGEIVKGNVITVSPEAITVNLNYKSDAVLPREEYSYEYVEDLTTVAKEGDEIEAQVVKLNDQDGNVLLSRKGIEEAQLWQEFEKMKSENIVLEVKINEAIESGLFTSVKGIKAFIPKSHICAKRNVDPSEFVGKTLEVNVLGTENKRRRRQLTLTGRAIDVVKTRELEAKAWETLKVDEIYEGTVKNIQDYGAFVNINGIDGLLHINEISWNRIKHPSEVLKVGDVIQVKVKSMDMENRKLSLSYKATIKSPWTIFNEKHKVGEVVTGKVNRVVDFGAFINIDGFDCLLHIKDLDWERTEKVTDIVNVGEEIECKIIKVMKKEKKVNLGLKQMTEHPFDVFANGKKPGDVLNVEITRITLEGVDVTADEKVSDFFIPIAKVSREKLRTPAQICKIGDKKDAKITFVDRKNKKLDLTFILEEKEEKKYPSKSKKGHVSYSTSNDEVTLGDRFGDLEKLKEQLD